MNLAMSRMRVCRYVPIPSSMYMYFSSSFSGMSFGVDKKNFDEIDTAGFPSFVKKVGIYNARRGRREKER